MYIIESSRKQKIFLIIIFLALGFLLSGCKEQKKFERKQNWAKVERRNIESYIEEEGEISPYKKVEVKAAMSGKVVKMYVEEGDIINKGDKIADIEADRDQTKNINNLLTTLEDAKINYFENKKNYEQNLDLYQKGFITENELKELQNKLILSELKYKSTKEEYELTLKEMGNINNINKKTYQVISPISGIILEKNIEEGELVSGESSTRAGTVIVVVADYKRLVVNVNINEFDIDKIKKNQDVDIKRVGKLKDNYKGKVYKISPQAITKDNIKVYPVKIEILNPSDELKFGMSVKLSIKIAYKNNVLAIPVTTLFIDDINKEYVLRKTVDNLPEKRFVKRGINNDFYVEIIDGLNEGDFVIDQYSSRNIVQNQLRNRRVPQPLGTPFMPGR